jgi:hypothetical protein
MIHVTDIINHTRRKVDLDLYPAVRWRVTYSTYMWINETIWEALLLPNFDSVPQEVKQNLPNLSISYT